MIAAEAMELLALAHLIWMPRKQLLLDEHIEELALLLICLHLVKVIN